MFRDFVAFLKEFNIVALAIGFVMGTASTSLVKSLVNDIFMPVVSPLFSSDSWREATLTFGPVHIVYGAFLGELINFLILALIVFIIAKKLLKIEKAK